MQRQIVALGGGGFRMRDSPLLDTFLLRLAGKSRPKICFIGTASGDAETYVRRFYQVFDTSRCRPSHFPVFSTPPRPAREHLLSQDLIYVGGGSTVNMLALWRLHKLDAILREAWENGTILSGPSAGAICWFEGSVTASLGEGIKPFREGLAFIPGSFCPHYEDDQARTATYRSLIARGFPAGIGAPETVAVRFSETDLADVVTARPGATAHRVTACGGDFVDTPVQAELLA
jgi:peptidase E